MIKTYEVLKKQAFQRMKEKTQERSFINYIYQNTNLSQIESQVVFEQFSRSFLTDDRQKLKEMQTLFIATRIEARPGQKLHESDYGEVVITLHTKEDEEVRENPSEFSKKYNFGDIDSTTAVRRTKLRRITEEVYRQGCVLTEEDLAYKLLNCGLRTVQRDISAFKNTGEHIPIRGAVCDIGRSVSHKTEAVKGFLKGEEIGGIARRIHHSPKAVERYLEKFIQVGSALEKGLKEPEISFLTRTSFSLLKEYNELYERAKRENKLGMLEDYLKRTKITPPKKNSGRDDDGE